MKIQPLQYCLYKNKNMTVDTTSAEIDVFDYKTLNAVLDLSAVSGTNPTMTVYIRAETLNAVNIVIENFPTLLGESALTQYVLSVDVSSFTSIDVFFDLGGTSPSFTIDFTLYAK